MKISHWPRLLAVPLIAAGLLLSGCAAAPAGAGSWPGITVADHEIYLAYHKIYAIRSDGSMKWHWPPTLVSGQAFYAPPAVSEDMVVVTDYTDTVFAIDRETGTTLTWYKTQGDPILGGLVTTKGPRFVGGATIGDQYVYAASDDGVLHALDKSDISKEVWSYKAEASIWATPLLDGNTLYVTSLDGHVYAFDAISGDLLWRFPENPEDAGDPPMGSLVATPTLHDGILYFGSFNKHVYALDTSTRTIQWSYPTTNWVWSSPVYDEENNLLIGADLDGHVFALYPTDGTEKWSYDVNGEEITTPIPIVGPPTLLTQKDGTRVAIFTVGGDPNLIVLNVEDGTEDIDPVGLKVTFSNDILFIKLPPRESVVKMYSPIRVDSGVSIPRKSEGGKTTIYSTGDLLLVGANEGNVQIYALESESLGRVWEFNSLKEEEAERAASAPADQGPFGSDPTQLIIISVVALVLAFLLGPRRKPAGGK